MGPLFVIAVCLVLVCVLVFIHYLVRLLDVCWTEDNRRKGQNGGSRYRDPFYASQVIQTKDLVDAPKKDMQLAHKSFELENESKWKGWSETVRDEMSHITTSKTHQRIAVGVVNIASVDPQGKYILIANASGILHPKDQDVSGWEIIRRINGKRERVFIFPPKTVIKANTTCKIWARGKGISDPPKALVFAGDTTWGTGDVAETVLLNKGEVQASLYWNTTNVNMESSDCTDYSTDTTVED